MKSNGVGLLIFVFLTAAAARCGWEAGAIGAAHAIKPQGSCPELLERTETKLRLRTAELEVTRGQLRACERRSKAAAE